MGRRSKAAGAEMNLYALLAMIAVTPMIFFLLLAFIGGLAKIFDGDFDVSDFVTLVILWAFFCALSAIDIYAYGNL